MERSRRTVILRDLHNPVECLHEPETHSCFLFYRFFSSQTDQNKSAPNQFDGGTDGGGDPARGGVKPGEKNRDDRPGEEAREQGLRDKMSLLALLTLLGVKMYLRCIHLFIFYSRV